VFDLTEIAVVEFQVFANLFFINRLLCQEIRGLLRQMEHY